MRRAGRMHAKTWGVRRTECSNRTILGQLEDTAAGAVDKEEEEEEAAPVDGVGWVKGHIESMCCTRCASTAGSGRCNSYCYTPQG